MNIYIDESGQSGLDLYDPQQPIFTYAAVWMTSEQDVSFQPTLTKLQKEHRLQSPKELKGAKLLKRHNGRAFVRSVLKALDDAAVPVSVVAVHKAFVAAAVIVEDCADYVYNEEFDERWTWDTTLKEPLAQKILRAADRQALMDAWRSRSGDSLDDFKRAHERLLFSLTLHADGALSRLAKKLQKARFDELWRASATLREEKKGYSPNLAAFTALLQGLDKQAEALGVTGATLMHDEQVQFEALFSEVAHVMKNASHGSVRLPNGNEFRFPTANLASIAFGKSEECAGIRVADIIAATIRVVLERTVVPTAEPAPIYSDALSRVLSPERTSSEFPYVIGPQDWQPIALRALVGKVRK